MAQTKPSKLEMQILSVLWDKGPLTVREVGSALPDGKQRAYTTVLSIMQLMEKKGLLARDRGDSLAHVYRPNVTPKQVYRPLMRDLLRNVFGGRASTAMQHLLAEADADSDELAEMRKLIEQYEGSSEHKGGK